MRSAIHLYLDSADRHEIARCLPHPLVYGVTTNPSLMRKAGLDWAALPDYLGFVLDQGAKVVQVQVQSRQAENMLRDAQRYVQWAEPGQVVVKIPITREGLTAAARLSRDGIPVTMTAVYAVEQALWAAMVGAHYAAAYLGRLDDQGANGLEVIRSMQALLCQPRTNPNPSLRLLVASLRTREAVTDVLGIGVGAITIPPSLFHELIERPETLEAERVFLRDAGMTKPSAEHEPSVRWAPRPRPRLYQFECIMSSSGYV